MKFARCLHVKQPNLAELLGVDGGPPVGLSYGLRVACSVVLSYLLANYTDPRLEIWAVVSAVVVIQPEVKASMASVTLRVVANLMGATVGISMAEAAYVPQFLCLFAAMLVLTGLCRVLQISAAARSACVSASVVLLKDPEGIHGSWKLRVLGVVLGCAVSVLVTAVVWWYEHHWVDASPQTSPEEN
jgi:uncharacterized membrane protein YgaE (UPF0421/DUF939 family)